jgi:hypothetical protein
MKAGEAIIGIIGLSIAAAVAVKVARAATQSTASKQPKLTTITVSPATASAIVAIGYKQQFTASTLDQNGNSITETVTWSSSDTNVGTIDSATGVFTAVAIGMTTITASYGGITGTSITTVIPLSAAGTCNAANNILIHVDEYSQSNPSSPSASYDIVKPSVGTPVQIMTVNRVLMDTIVTDSNGNACLAYDPGRYTAGQYVAVVNKYGYMPSPTNGASNDVMFPITTREVNLRIYVIYVPVSIPVSS